MKIKLVNKTAYSTRDLRAFLRAGLRALGARSDKVVVVRYQRVVWQTVDQDGVRRVEYGPLGRGRLGRPGREAQQIWLHLPREPETLVVGDVAHTLYHELLHNRGARHRDMTHEQRFWNGVPAPWCEGLSIGLEPEKPQENLIERREAHAREMLALWTKKQRLALTLRRKWAAKVRRYERIAAKREKQP